MSIIYRGTLVMWIVALTMVVGACSVIPDTVNQPGIALIFGAGDYSPTVFSYNGSSVSFPDLNGPINDANAVADSFTAQGWTVYNEISSASPALQNATYSRLLSDIGLISATVQPYQRVLIYYSGHGMQPGNLSSGAILGESLVFTDANYTTGNGFLSAAQLAQVIQPLLAKKALVTVVIDACYSGGFVGDGSYTNNLPANYGTDYYKQANAAGATFGRTISDYFNGKAGSTQGAGLGASNLWVISAAGPAEESWESWPSGQAHLARGAFSKAFLDAFSYGDTNNDGRVTVFEAYRYAYRYINEVWNPTYRYTLGSDYLFLPHLYGNPSDLVLYTK